MPSSANFTNSAPRGLAFASIAIAAVAAAIAIHATIRSSRTANRELVLVAPDGQPRVRLAALPEGGTIELLDEHGRARLALLHAGKRTSIWDPSSRVREQRCIRHAPARG